MESVLSKAMRDDLSLLGRQIRSHRLYTPNS
jgi:hypothetical protein